MTEYLSPNIQNLAEKLAMIPFTKVKLLDKESRLRATRPFFVESIYPIRVEFNEGHINVTILCSGYFGDFVGIRTYGQPSIQMVNEVLRITNEFYITKLS
jgi:hypothetical protein